MLNLYLEKAGPEEISFVVSDEYDNVVDKIVFKGKFDMPDSIDAALVAYLPKLLKNRAKLKLLGPVSVGLIRGAKAWLKAKGFDNANISSKLRVNSINKNNTWLMAELIPTLNIVNSYIPDEHITNIAIGLLFCKDYKGLLLNCTDFSYELLSTQNFTIIADGKTCSEPLI